MHHKRNSSVRSRLSPIPSFHTNPVIRLSSPLELNVPNHNPTSPLHGFKFFHVASNKYRGQRELIYDPNDQQMRVDGPKFSGDFECGNLGQVYRLAPRVFEIHILPDTTKYYSALWYFFKVENMAPGEYTFIISGFFRDSHLHKMGVQPTALSMRSLQNGVGWQRYGRNLNFWCVQRGPPAKYALSFTFALHHNDTIYFSYLYPYSYSRMVKSISRFAPKISPSYICKTLGGVNFPVIFWDADVQRCVNANMIFQQRVTAEIKKPLIVITARHHPGESNASYAMEGFMNTLFASNSYDSQRLLSNFSFFIIPMMNPDGVICGYYRPSLAGYDMNRVWKKPSSELNPVEYTIVSMLDKLVKNRPIIFFLDYHGHTSQCNAFTYGVCNDDCPLNEYESYFPSIMSSLNSLFDEEGSCTLHRDSYAATMRVALHHRYMIPFSYTLEMTFGGIDIGNKSGTQMTPDDYKSIGESTIPAIAIMLLDNISLHQYIRSYCPPHIRSVFTRS